MARRRYRRKRRAKRGSFYIGVILIAAGIWWIMNDLASNSKHIVPDWLGMDKPIFVQGELMEHSARGTKADLKLPLPVIQEAVDSNIRYEPDSKSIIITTTESVLRMKIGSREGELNGKPLTYPVAPELVDGIVYVPMKSLKEHYGIAVHEDGADGAVILMRAGDSIQLAEVAPAKPDGTVAMREGMGKKSPIVLDLSAGQRLRIWREEAGWYFVQTDNGYTGYVPVERVAKRDLKEIPVIAQTPSRAEREWRNKSVNLAWEAVYTRNPSPDHIEPMPGVNVVSPTWFSISDAEGSVKSKASLPYVNWAHKRNMEVWGLLDNSFDPELTTEALSTYERRSRTIGQTLSYAKQYKLDGINIDFENVHTKDKDKVVQFVRELRPFAKDRGLILSIDVTPKSNSEMWSLFLDRKRLGEAVDYMMVMAYDEHWASSPRAGSVASLPWAEQSVRRIIEEDGVPPSKLVLGVPLYTRVWTEKSDGGEVKVSSKAIGMETMQTLLKERKLSGTLDSATGQNYVQFKEGGATNRIWMEDGVSLKARVQLAKKLELGGIAAWNRSFAVPEAWKTLNTIHD
ncbi:MULTISPECIES: glycosyl hydrolase family 18 protein [Paenibacillus]|uniref:glycosyl hydrolase family 18 protein n=1 Tax=Paenibacillus TaxID=44249 RepID=UPI001B27E4EE|nr:glycosyl hydrolase family 18 protein [Paenibacillus lactis]GIO94863.1 hypothetical protein J31TS3_60900 [Paenibacillus lactis]